MKILESINIIDYRSFTNETVKLDNLTCVVGANESGKSNLLNAIYHLSDRMREEPFKPEELRLGAKNYPYGEVRITFKIKLNSFLLGKLSNYFKYLDGAYFNLTKRGKPNSIPKWECNLEIQTSKLMDIVKINNKKIFLQKLKSKKTKEIKEHAERGWFLNDRTVDLRKKPYNKLLEENKIVLLTSIEKKSFVEGLIKEDLLERIKIFKWLYKETDFLTEIIIIDDFIRNPSSFKTVKSMFHIAGWRTSDFDQNLTNQIDTVYINLFKQVEKQINKIIRKNWSTHKKLEIILQHKGDYFTINLTEPGSITPPQYRSDGLKWFLTFLINFRAQSKNLSNYILLIDEPGLHLHPRGQKDTLEELKILCENFSNQIIYSTHQTFLIDKNCPEKVRIIKRDLDKSGALASNPFYASKITDIENPKSILTDKLLREALGFDVSDISPLNEKNILVEGVFDRELFHLLNKKWLSIDLNDTSIISCFGCGEIAKHANLYLSNGLKVMCFYDSDASGRSCFTRNKVVKQRFKKQIRDFISDTNIETIEDLIPEQIFREAYLMLCKKFNLKEITINIPRMKNLEPVIRSEKKIEMKHYLENSIIDLIKKNYSKIENDLENFKLILEGLAIKD